MTTFSFPLATLDAFRFAASRDVSQVLTEMGATSRQQVAERLGIHIDYVPDMDDLVGPMTISLMCSATLTQLDEPGQPVGKCSDTASRICVMGCVHEHIATAPLCHGHWKWKLLEGEAWCGLCERAGSKVALVEINEGRAQHVDAFLLDMLMVGVTDETQRQSICEFVSANLNEIIPSYLREL